jgi:hypothetical protein
MIVNPGPCTIKVGGATCNASPNNVVFNPGTYGGVTICGGSRVQFNSGFYAFTNNGGLSISGTSSASGSGVTFYATNNQPISIMSTGTGAVLLAAPTAGTYAGILLYQDRNDSAGGTIQLGSAPNQKLEGALYFLNATTLSIHDIGTAAAYTIVVAGSLDVHSNNNIFHSDYSSLSNGSPIRDAVLVE